MYVQTTDVFFRSDILKIAFEEAVKSLRCHAAGDMMPFILPCKILTVQQAGDILKTLGVTCSRKMPSGLPRSIGDRVEAADTYFGRHLLAVLTGDQHV